MAAVEKSLLPEARIDVPAGARTETLKSAPPSILFVQTAARPSIEWCGLLARLTQGGDIAVLPFRSNCSVVEFDKDKIQQLILAFVHELEDER